MGLRRFIRARVAWVSRTALARRLGPKALPPFEAFMRVVTGGRVQASGLLVPSLVLHSRGARSGEWRSTELMYCPGVDPADRLIVGSGFAGERHPAWTYNLLAHPDAALTERGRRSEVRAVPVPDDEREAVWAHIEDQWPGYREYERISGRTFRIFRLVRR